MKSLIGHNRQGLKYK